MVGDGYLCSLSRSANCLFVFVVVACTWLPWEWVIEEESCGWAARAVHNGAVVCRETVIKVH